MTTNQPLTLTEKIRKILRRSAHPGSPHNKSKPWPTPSQYARWCSCTPQHINKFANRKSKSVGHEILDDLASLTGVYPPASNEQRLRRLKRADKWLSNPDLQRKYNRVSDFVLLKKRKSVAEIIAIMKAAKRNATSADHSTLKRKKKRNHRIEAGAQPRVSGQELELRRRLTEQP